MHAARHRRAAAPPRRRRSPAPRSCVVGRGITVGRPLGLLLTRRSENATVTLCHTGTRDLAAHVRRADIVVAAAGVPGIITGDMVKPGAAVLDVGVTRDDDGKLVGDVAPDVYDVAGWVSPNPGGVGPMTRAMLLTNIVEAAETAGRTRGRLSVSHPPGADHRGRSAREVDPETGLRPTACSRGDRDARGSGLPRRCCVAACVGLLIVGLGPWRLGHDGRRRRVPGGRGGAGGDPRPHAGMLQLRRKAFDVPTLAMLGASLILAAIIPSARSEPLTSPAADCAPRLNLEHQYGRAAERRSDQAELL